jgi:hypothetical protein
MITRMTPVSCLTIRCRESERISRIFHCRILIFQPVAPFPSLSGFFRKL